MSRPLDMSNYTEEGPLEGGPGLHVIGRLDTGSGQRAGKSGHDRGALSGDIGDSTTHLLHRAALDDFDPLRSETVGFDHPTRTGSGGPTPSRGAVAITPAPQLVGARRVP